METENYVYKKEIDWSTLMEGFTLPLDNQVIFLRNMENFLQRGESKIIHFFMNGKTYDAKIVNVNNSVEKRKKDAYQIRYTRNGELAQAFQLRLPGDEGLPREAVKAKQANKEFVSRIHIIDELIPKLDEEGNNLGDILKIAWNTETPHRIILADGGMGKSTMLLKICKESNEPVLYIPLERLVAIGSSIKSYCARVLFDGSEESFEKYTGIRYSSPSLTLLIDGMNEINAGQERQFINEIKALNLFKGIQVVVSSRSDFTVRYSMADYSICRLTPLSDEQIMSVFSQEEWSGIRDAVTLRHLLTNPMMVTMYQQISPIIKQYEHEESLDWILPIKNATDLLYDYYVAQIAVLFQRSAIDGQKVQIAYLSIFDILPAVAYAYEVTYRLNKENAEFRSLLQEMIQSNVIKKRSYFLCRNNSGIMIFLN